MGVPKVGINGFGRIGRLVLRALLGMEERVDIVGINDLASNEALAHLFEYDSVHGKFNGTVEVTSNELIFNGDDFSTYEERDPSNLPWEELDTDFVIESTGIFRTRDGMEKHLEAGSKQVILSAPAKSQNDVDVTIVRGVNNDWYKKDDHKLISNASCTTNCLAPTMKVLDDAFGFEQGNFTTIHAYTNDQRILDSFHKDYRRMRSAGLNMFPTSTGASKAIGIVMPHLAGKVDGLAVRIPTPNVSIVDLTARLKSPTKVDGVIEAFKNAEKGPLKGILLTENRQLVSTDFNSNPHSAIIDVPTVKMIENNLVKVLAWYDNEWAYANRVAELLHELHEKNTQ